MAMTRTHNTNQPGLYPANYIQVRNRLKPNGLWYGINDEWISWCAESWDDRIGKNNYELTVDLQRICVLSHWGAVLEFQREYEMPLLGDPMLTCIDWFLVTKDYSGIEIRNYSELKWDYYYPVGPHRIELSWFTTLDCSCGCVWDLSAVREIRNRLLKTEL